MAGDWHKIRNNLRDDPRVHAIKMRTMAHVAHVVGACSVFWSLVDEHGRDGFLPFYLPEAVDELVGIKGFIAAMIEVGWVEIADGGLQAVNWGSHNGSTAKERAQAANRQSERRASPCKSTRVTAERDRSVTGARESVTVPRDNSVTREEKRREEQNRPPTPQAAIAVPDGGGGGGGESEAGDSEPKPRAPEVARILASVRSVAVRAELAALPDAVIVAAHELSAKVPKAHDRVAMMVAMARDGTAAGEVKARQRRAELDAEKRASDVARAEAERAEAERNRAESERTRVEAETSIDAASHLALKSAIRAAAERCPGKLRSELSAFVSLDPPIEALREQAKRRVIVRMVGEQLAGVARWNAG